jgi:hypothetical protein
MLKTEKENGKAYTLRMDFITCLRLLALEDSVCNN